MLSLLYVDDEPGLLEIGRLFLENTGDFSVTTALSGREGLETLARHGFDAVVADYQMPEMDGIELLKNVRRSFGNIPFILFTGRGREEVVIEAINNGVDFYLQKGGDPAAQFAELAHKVRQAVSRRQAETGLLDSEKRLADIINFLPDATFAIDTDGKVITWNRAIEEMTGVPAADMVGKGDYEYAIPFYNARRPILIDLIFESDEVISKKYANITRHKNILSADTSLPSPKGMQVTLMGVAGPLFDRKGKLIGSIESIRDITDRKKYEIALRQSEERYRTLAEISPDAILVHQDGRIVYANPAALRLVGASRNAEIAGKPLMELIHPLSRDLVKTNIQSDIRGEHTLSVEVRMLRLDGQTVTVEGSGVLTMYEGRPAIQVAIRDITERKRVEEELRAANEQLVATGEELRAQYDELARSEARIRLSEARLTYMLGFYEYSQKSEKELLGYAIEGAGIVTGSSLGYLAFLNEDESELAMYAWSKAAMAECSMQEKPVIYRTEKTGLWGEAVRQRRPVITNDYAAPDPAKKGYPEGHPHIVRHMNVPVTDEGRIVLVAGVANKQSDYTEHDVSELLLLMQGLWTIIKRKHLEEEQKAAYEQLAAASEELRAQYDALAKSEERIRESEERFKTLFDRSAEAQLLLDDTGKVTDCNAAFLTLFALPDKQEVLGHVPEEFAPEFQPDGVRSVTRSDEIFARVMKEGMVQYEWAHLKHDAERTPILTEVICTIIQIGGQPVIHAGIRDITDRKQAEKALRESEKNYRGVIENLQDVFYRADASGTITMASPSVTEVFGYGSVDEVIGLNLARDIYLDPENRSDFLTALKKTGRVKNFEAVLKKKDGSPVIVSTSAHYYHDPDGNVLGVEGIAKDITEWKHAEEALRQSEARFRAVIDQSFQFIGLMDTDGTLVVANRSALAFAGISESDVINRPFWETPWWSHSEELQNKLKDAIHRAASGETVRFEATHRAANGNLAYIDFSVKPVVDPAGRILYLIPEGRDITERKLAEQALRESEEKFRQLITSAPIPISFASSNGEIEFVNARFTQLFGYTHAEIPTLKEWFDFAYPDKEYQKQVLDTWNAAVTRGLKNGTDIEPSEYRVTCKDGSVRNVIISGITIQGKLLATFIDNTGQRKTEEALRESEQKYRTLVEKSQDGVFIVQDNRLVFYNRAFAEMTGYNEEELIGRFIHELIAPEDRETVMARHHDRVSGGAAPVSYEFSVLHKDGSTRILVRMHAGMAAFRGRPATIGTFRNITEDRKREIALRESEEKYRTLVEKSQDGIVIVQDERIVFANGALRDMIGYSDDELLGHSVQEFVAPEDAGPVIARHRERMSGRDVTASYEYSLLHKDGSTRVLVKMNAGLATYRGRPAMIATFQNVTLERKREAALRESEEKYRTLVESSFDGIAIHQDGIIVYANRTAARLLGSEDPAVFIGKHAIDLAAPAFRDLIAERVQRSPDKAMELVREQFLRLDGTPIDVDVTTTPTTWQGRPAAYVTFRDITAQVRAEEALRESEEKYRMLVEQSRDGVFIIQDDRLVFYNKALVGMTGYTAEELDGRLLGDLIAPEDRQMVVSRAEDRAKGKEVPELYEFSLLHKDGATRSRIRVRAGLGNYKGRPASIGMFFDVTEDRRREEALRESEAKFRELTELLPQIVFEMDPNMMITFVNRQAYTALGYTPEEIAAGFNALSIVDPSQHDRVRQNIAKLVRKEPYEHLEYTFRKKDGGTFPALIYADRMFKDGELKGFRGIIIDISDRKKAEEALEESEEKFRALVETTSDFIWEVDASGTYTYVSPQVRRILGYEPEDLLGKTPFDFMPPDDAEKIAAVFSRCVASRLPIVALENKAARKDGSVVILETSGVVRTAEDGSYLGYRGIDRDITLRKEAEEALKESEARLSSILHGSPVLQFVIDRNHRVISWNKALEEYSGIGAAEMIGTDQQWKAFYANRRPVLADLLVDGDIGAINRLYAGKLRKSRYVEGAFEATDFFPHMGSSGIWLSFTAAPVRNELGKIIGAVETLEDVTERINAENALRESGEYTRTILNTAQAGIILVDAKTHRIIDANRKALELIGLDKDSVIGTVCHRFICPAEEGRCPVTDLNQEIDTSERILLTSAGEKIPVLKTVVRVSMGGRDILVESFVDITERKRSEDAIREANRKLNLLNSITRHDIRNQLMVAQGYAQLAAFSKPEPVVADFLAKIAAAVQTIQRQIEFTKEYQELGVHAPAWFMIGSVVGMVRPERIAVKTTCNGAEIFADPMIDKVFYNLFDNALKHGEGVTTVTIGCRETDRGLVITFADNGAGIPAGEKQKIFEKGYGKNTGFGLFLAREILAITGITIEETGTEGRGAVFEISVPKGAYRKAE